MTDRPEKRSTKLQSSMVQTSAAVPITDASHTAETIVLTAAGASHGFYAVNSPARISNDIVYTTSPAAGPYNIRYHRRIFV
jgi:hypothetical protein